MQKSTVGWRLNEALNEVFNALVSLPIKGKGRKLLRTSREAKSLPQRENFTRVEDKGS